MDDTEFEKALGDLRRRPMPQSPAKIEANVLRRIRRDRPVDEPQGLYWLFALARQTRFVAVAISLAAMTSLAVTAVSAVGRQSGENDRRTLASQALHFESLRSTSLISLDRPE